MPTYESPQHNNESEDKHGNGLIRYGERRHRTVGKNGLGSMSSISVLRLFGFYIFANMSYFACLIERLPFLLESITNILYWLWRW